MSSQPRLANAFWVRSVTLCPTAIATVSVETTSGLPNSDRRGVLGVEVHLVGVHRQQREPGVVGLADGPAERVLVDVADVEVLEEPSVHLNPLVSTGGIAFP